jgi:hypothetical protein
MKLALPGVVLLALAAAPGCDRVLLPVQHPVYAAWEEGLTLGYEDPTLDSGLRQQRRQQVRVKQSQPQGSAMAVTKTFTSMAGQWETQVLQKDGGVLLQAEHTGGILLLPEGFPDRVSRWESRGSFNWVVGRESVQLPGVHLADPAGAVGVWVESISLDGSGSRTRTLYLPDIGEAETLSWIQGRWVATNLLVSRGFTDIPGKAASNPSGSDS